MSRALIIIDNEVDRRRVAQWAAEVPVGTRVEFKATKRTLPQNDRMWAMLSEVSKQKEHAGRHYPPEDWKELFMHALGRETRFVPSLDGATFLPLGRRSSDLSVEEMTDLIEFMFAWGAENGVVFHEPAAEKAA